MRTTGSSSTNTRTKRRSKRGFTLVETLCAVIVCVIAMSLVTLTLQTATNAFTRSTRESEAQILCGTLTTAVQDELRYATEISGDGGNFTYYSNSRSLGQNCKIYSNGDGKIVLDSASESGYMLVNSSAYVYDLKAKLDVSWDPAAGQFTAAITISAEDGDEIVSSAFAVRPVSGE